MVRPLIWLSSLQNPMIQKEVTQESQESTNLEAYAQRRTTMGSMRSTRSGLPIQLASPLPYVVNNDIGLVECRWCW